MSKVCVEFAGGRRRGLSPTIWALMGKGRIDIGLRRALCGLMRCCVRLSNVYIELRDCRP